MSEDIIITKEKFEILRRAAIENAERKFALLENQPEMFFPRRADSFAKNIHDLMDSGNIAWDELSFTDKILNRALRALKVYHADVIYKTISENIESINTMRVIQRVEKIRELMRDNNIDWNELRFTEVDLTKIIHGLKQRPEYEPGDHL